MIFDGRAFAREIEERVASTIRSLASKPRVISILVGGDQASELYTRLKSEAAKRCGIEFAVQKYTKIPLQKLREKIKETGIREDVTGLMVQLPLPGLQGQALQEVLSEIPLSKDVDGLRWEESGIKPAAVRAVLSILDKIAQDAGIWNQETRFVVVGARGAVGRPLSKYLRERGVRVIEVEAETQNPAELIKTGKVIISCVGKAGLITDEMITGGAIVIDVGMSEVAGKAVGDMTQEVYQKASIAVTVPGGVGPVTIASLMENTKELSG